MPISILKIENNRIAKFAEFSTLVEAQAHTDAHIANYPTAFTYNGNYTPDLFIDVNNNVTVAPIADTRTYQQKRIAEYPPMADYLDAIVKGDTVQQQAYIDACLAVKAKYQKV